MFLMDTCRVFTSSDNKTIIKKQHSSSELKLYSTNVGEQTKIDVLIRAEAKGLNRVTEIDLPDN